MSEPKRRKWTMYDQARVVRAVLPYACFRCRKSFHRSVVWSKTPDVMKCPECGDEAVGLSPDFKAPRRSDKAQWKKVELLVRGGFRFYHHGRYPQNLREIPEFIASKQVQGWLRKSPV